MWWLTRRHLARLVDSARVTRAVEEAERATAGEIVVSIAPFFWGSVDGAARRAFARLRVAETRSRAGVLLFLVPARRRFVVLGDEAIHARVGQSFWDELARGLAGRLRGGDLTAAVIACVAAVGAALKEHFPLEGTKANELPDRPDLEG